MSLRKSFVFSGLVLGMALVGLFGASSAHAAESIYIYPTTAVATPGTYQTATAIVDGVENKDVTWSAPDGGTVVGINPCTVADGPCTAALYTTTPGTYRLVATSNASPSVTATSHITITATQTPTTGHPRLDITAAMLPGLQAKATTGNVIYQAIKTIAIREYTADNAVWSWSCNGGTGLPSTNESQNYEEVHAYYYAFMALVDPNDPTYNWGCYGRDTWTYAISEVLNGATTFSGNHWSDSSPDFAFTTDWLMGSNSLSASDIALSRQFLAYAVKTVINYSYGVSAPIGNYDSSLQFSTGNEWDLDGERAFGNNYTESRILYITAAALTFDDNTTDDPPLANTCNATRYQVCPDASAGSLHAYWTYLTGGMLYDDYAHLEDPNVSWQAYERTYGNLPTQPTCKYLNGTYYPCFGDGSGGESVEGSWYQYSMFRLRDALNSIYTAGYDNPVQYGPQLSLISSSWWDMKGVVDLEFLTGEQPGARYAYLTTGDTYTYYRDPSNFEAESSIMVYDTYIGRTDDTATLEWPILNTAFGGPSGKLAGCTSYCGIDEELGNDYGDAVDMDLFIALPAEDPATQNLPADPRPSLPTDLYNSSLNQHIMVRNNFSTAGTLFSYYCPNTLTDHEEEYCGRFDIFSNGEYITKGRTEFNDYNDTMSDAQNQNLVAIQNVTGSTCATTNCLEWAAANFGGQFWHDEQNGLVTLQHEEMPSYVAANVDDTNVYNASDPGDYPGYTDVKQASRSLIYLRNSNEVVYYDRAVTGHTGFKDLYLNTTGPVTLNGNSASWHTQSGSQVAYFTSLLPAGATVSNPGLVAGGVDQTNDWELVSTLEVNGGTPTSTQFLSVLQWGSTGLTQAQATLVQSTGGTIYQGALVGTNLAMFKENWGDTVSYVAFPASGATTIYVSDLSPNTTYNISGTGVPSSGSADAAGDLVFSATGSGTITITASGSSAPSGDTTPPTISLTSPATNSTVLGTISLAATASDNVGVTSVQFFVDGSGKGTDVSSPYTYSLDTTSLTNGPHTISAKAYDAAGNVGTSATVSVTVANTTSSPPDTTAPSVPQNLLISGITTSNLTISWSASTDNVGVAGYNIYRGGTKIASVTSADYTDSGLAASTTYSYTVSAFDAAGNTSAKSGSVSGTTDAVQSVNSSDTTPPSAVIITPGNDAVLSGDVTVLASASDNVGVTSVALYVDNTLMGTKGSSPYSFPLDTSSLTNGTHTISVKAYDAAGNVGTSGNVTVTVANGVSVTPPPSSGGGSSGEGSVVTPPPVTIPPVTTSPSFEITSVSVSNITTSTARITVTTHVAASIQIKYGPTTAFGEETNVSAPLTTSYELLTGLAPSTVYDFAVIATPDGGTPITSNVYVLTTASSPTASTGGGTVSQQGPAFPQDIAYGDTGSEVLLLQQTLQSLGFFPSTVSPSTYFGAITEHALLLFQNAHDLNKSGFVDVQSQSLLNKIAAAEGTALTQPATTSGATTPATPASSTGLTLTRNLTVGSTGADVTALQNFLFTDGDYPQDLVTGYYGSLTEAAVKIFQAKEGVVSSGSPATTGYGSVGPRTRAALGGI